MGLPGLAVATIGLSHFRTPDVYESITEAAYAGYLDTSILRNR